MNCPICNSSRFCTHLKVGNYSILKCQNCSHGILEGFDNARYDESYFASHYKAPRLNTAEFSKKIKEQSHRVKKVIAFIKKGRLLDIGCGLGHFLYAAKISGYDVMGYDFVETNKDYVTNTLGIELLTSSEDNSKITNNKFDIVTSWHSLEHSTNPNQYLQFTRKALCDKGILIIEVPTHDCIDAFVMGQSWPNWDPPFHYQHFTQKSLRPLLNKNGYKIIREYTYNCDYIRNTLKKSPFFLFARSISKLFRGSSVACICKKI